MLIHGTGDATSDGSSGAQGPVCWVQDSIDLLMTSAPVHQDLVHMCTRCSCTCAPGARACVHPRLLHVCTRLLHMHNPRIRGCKHVICRGAKTCCFLYVTVVGMSQTCHFRTCQMSPPGHPFITNLCLRKQCSSIREISDQSNTAYVSSTSKRHFGFIGFTAYVSSNSFRAR